MVQHRKRVIHGRDESIEATFRDTRCMVEDCYRLRTEFVGVTGKVFQALGIAAPPAVRRAEG